MKIQRFLSLLNARQAFYLFFLALAVSIFLIFAEIGEPWSASLPVIAYGYALFFVQKKYSVALNSTVKDSPYFLGFILTLIGLVEILSSGFTETANTSVLVSKVATAIFPTVCGIFFRQLLLSWDPEDAYFDREYQTIAEALRTDAANFRDSQARFVQLVSEFTKTREELLSGEEKIFTDYVGALKEGTSVLSKIQRNYPKRIEGLLQEIEGITGKVSKAGETIQATVVGLSNTYSQEFEQSRKVLAAARTELENETLSANSAFGKSIVGFSQHAEGLNKAATSHLESAKLVQDATTKLAQRIVESGTGMSQIVSDLTRLSGEIRAIDGVVGDLINLLNSRIRDLRATG